MIDDIIGLMPAQSRTDGRFIHVKDPAWEAALGLAARLGCLAPDGSPSVSRLVSEIGEGSIRVTRVKAARPLSMAARIREQIDLDPAATDRDIARRLGSNPMQVSTERTRYTRKKGAAPQA